MKTIRMTAPWHLWLVGVTAGLFNSIGVSQAASAEVSLPSMVL